MPGNKPSFEQVTTKNLVKMFGPTRALGGVSLTFQAGTVTGVMGTNGSGKSTLVSILAQLARPTRGKVQYGNLAPSKVRGRIGLLSHAPMVYPNLSGRANLEFYSALYEVADPKKRIDELVERFEIGRYFERACHTYSRGQLQRVALARAVLHKPKLLLLDEPSTGLDDGAIQRLAEAVADERDRGTILVLVTHNQVFADDLCDRQVRLSRGKVVESDA